MESLTSILIPEEIESIRTNSGQHRGALWMEFCTICAVHIIFTWPMTFESKRSIFLILWLTEEFNCAPTFSRRHCQTRLIRCECACPWLGIKSGSIANWRHIHIWNRVYVILAIPRHSSKNVTLNIGCQNLGWEVNRVYRSASRAS